MAWLSNNTSIHFNQKHSFNLGLMLTQGGQPSVRDIGDLQTFSNLEAGFLYGFNEVYYQYEAEEVWLKIGQQDINTDFMFSDNGLLFAHSSFGIDPATTINLPAPTYPYAALSITTRLSLFKQIDLRLGIFDGQFAKERGSFLPIYWSLKKSEGLIYLIEPELTWLNQRAITKFGLLYHSGDFENKSSGRLEKGLVSFYSISDFKFFSHGQKNYHLFYQVNSSSKSVIKIDFYLGLGLRLENPFHIKLNHEFGLAMAYAHINSDQPIVNNSFDIGSETVL